MIARPLFLSARPLLLLGLLSGFPDAAIPATATAADDPVPALAKVAETFVEAYNGKKLDAILALYTPQAEIIGESEERSASGIDEIRALYEASFTAAPGRRLALEVVSVREIAAGIVVEEGFAHFSDEGEDEVSSLPYSAILAEDKEAGWRIASTRELPASDPETPDPLEGLHALEGDWFHQGDQIQMHLSLALAASGRFLSGFALITTPADGTMETEIRIGTDPATGQVRWWTFDESGGFAGGTWQEVGDHWLVRTNGVTASGEITSAIQELRFEDHDSVLWTSSHRFLDGQPLPDAELRLERRPPAPALSFGTELPEPAAEAAPAAPEPSSNDPKP